MQRLVTLTRRSHHAVIRLFSSSPTASSLSRPSTLPVYNDHRSNAETLVNAIPAIEVAGTTALCEGGGGATGHPVEYIKLDKREGASPSACKYCGLRYIMKAGHHGH